MLKELILNSLRDLKFNLVFLKEPEGYFLNQIKDFLKDLRKNNYFFYLPEIKKKDLSNFIFFLRVLDFRLWEFPENWKINQKRGYWGLAKRLTNLFDFGIENLKFDDWDIALRSARAQEISESGRFQNFKKIISPRENLELAKLRHKLFDDCYLWLLKRYKGDFNNYFEENENPYQFVFNLLDLEKFRDYSHLSKRFYFLKPSQLLYIEHILGQGKINKFSEELKDLTAFSDNVLPAILLRAGIIKAKESLTDKINKNKEILKNSKEERELRAASIFGCETIKKKLGLDYSFEVDFALWNLAQKTRKRIRPIRVKTIFY